MTLPRIALCLSLLSFSFPSGLAAAESELALGAAKDNTLYQDLTGTLSNGAGEHFFAGRTGQASGADIRRGLIEFDLEGVLPAGSSITGVTLRLHMSMSPVGDQTIALHRVLSEWGEAGSDAPMGEGTGTTAQPGDATWVHTYYPSSSWASAGGDFDPVPSHAIVVTGPAHYEWSSALMLADVQAWVADPSANHGWILIGNEIGTTTSKRFDTRQNLTPDYRPSLILSYVPPSTPYCFGLGCPCGNDSAVGGCGNGSFPEGCALSATGTPSVSNDSVVLLAARSTPAQPGLFFQGDNAVGGGAGAPFGDGLRCAGGGVVRLQVRIADGSGAAASTVAIAAAAGLSAGDVKRYQWWYRDPALSPCGSGFNLSNGLEILWCP